MGDLTCITHTPTGYTITTGYELVLAEDATHRDALTALFHRGFTPQTAVESLNAAVRIGHFAVVGLTAA
jgi:hypothetical protein